MAAAAVEKPKSADTDSPVAGGEDSEEVSGDRYSSDSTNTGGSYCRIL